MHPLSIPQVGPLNLLRCQGQNLPLNSNPVSYYNVTDNLNPTLVGTESNFQYVLPTGWSIGTNTSNGSDWISSTNLATITTLSSDGVFKVRAVNGCAAGLNVGPEANVTLLRPAPQLTVVGDSFLCSGSKSYTIGGVVPPGASFCWSVSNTNYASLGVQCGPSTSLNYVGNGVVKLSATATDCLGTYPVTYPADVMVGTSVGGYYFITSNYHSSGNQLSLFSNNSTVFLPANQGFGINAYLTSPGRTGNATWVINSNSYPFFWYQIGASTLTFSGNSAPTAYQQRTGTFNLSVPTVCGTYNGQFSWPIVTQGWSFRVALSPNPSSSTLNVSLLDGDNTSAKLATTINSEIKLDVSRFDNAKQAKSWSFKGGLSDFTLDISDLPNGTYVVRITIDGTSKSSQIVIRR